MMLLLSVVVDLLRLQKQIGILGVLFLISPELTAEELGFSKKNLKEIAAKHNEGFYIKLIDSLPVENKEKKRLLRDADIQDAEIVEEIQND